MTKHKIAFIFLVLMNIINFAAGAVTEITVIRNGDVISVIPITVEMTVDQILMLNFIAVALIIALISIVTAYLVADAPYSFGEIIKNCPAVFLIIPAIVVIAAVFNAVNVPEMQDKTAIIISAAVYFLLSAVNFGCLITVKEDGE